MKDIFDDQTKAPKGRKDLFKTAPSLFKGLADRVPPHLKAWIHHWKYSIHNWILNETVYQIYIQFGRVCSCYT